MFEDMITESYESLFDKNFIAETYNKENKNTTVNKKREQNDIITRESYDFSLEDDDSSDFESSSGDSGGDDSFDDGGEITPPSFGDDGGDSGGDDSFGSDGDSSDDGSSNDSGENDGLETIDKNKGSSLNPFTQINQKLYHIDRLNELLNSIKHSVDLYNVNYADWSEVDQLKELGSIVADEQKSFVMQQNPENLIKLGLYYEQYDKIVQNISMKISRLNSNNKN